MNTNIILLIAAAGAAYMIFKSKAAAANTVNNLGNPINGISEIFTGAKAGQAGAGWRYFTDGTSIDPQGNYYMNGTIIWTK